jgi:hypothetical protein
MGGLSDQCQLVCDRCGDAGSTVRKRERINLMAKLCDACVVGQRAASNVVHRKVEGIRILGVCRRYE